MRQQRLWIINIIGTFILLSASIGYAQDDPPGIWTRFTDTFDGYVKNSTAIRLEEPDRFVKIDNRLKLTYSDWLSDNVGLTLTGLVVYDAVYDVEDDLEVEDEEEYRAYADVREAFIDLTLGDFDMRFGRQHITWGKTDGFRITDLVNPLDLREFGLADFLDSKIPLWMAKIDWYFSMDYALQFLVIPDLRFTELAHAGSEYAFAQPTFPTGVRPVVNETKEPETSVENTEYGVKLSGYYEGWDFTLNYFYTWDDAPTVKKNINRQTGTLSVAPEHERLHIVGGTVATQLWDAVVRAEIAAHLGRYFSVGDMTVPDMVVDKSFLSYALAWERSLLEVDWLVQFLQEMILDYEDAITDDEVNTRVTLRGSKRFINDTLEIALTAAYGANDDEFLLRPTISYDITDVVEIKGGVDLFEGGNEDSLIGQFDDRDRLYAELKYSF